MFLGKVCLGGYCLGEVCFRGYSLGDVRLGVIVWGGLFGGDYCLGRVFWEIIVWRGLGVTVWGGLFDGHCLGEVCLRVIVWGLSGHPNTQLISPAIASYSLCNKSQNEEAIT